MATARRKSSYREMREMMVCFHQFISARKPATQIRRHHTRQDGVVDDGLGCRSAHPDTGAGGQHGGDVSHQPPPQRIEVRVSLVSLVLVCFVFRLAGIWPSLSKGHIAVHVRPDMHVRVPDECAVVSMDTLSIYE